MVLELLKARGLEGIARNYEKNVHPRVADIEEAIKTVRNLLKVISTKKYMEPEETKILHSRCRGILDSYYSFTERLEQFSKADINQAFPKNKVFPSFHDTHKTLIQARIGSAHYYEATYTYETSKGVVGCPTDTAAYPYQGECYSIEVEFKKEDGSPCYMGTVDSFINKIEFNVECTLDRYREALNQRLP